MRLFHKRHLPGSDSYALLLPLLIGVLVLSMGNALAQSSEPPDLEKVKSLLTQLDQYLNLLDAQIKTNLAQSERYLEHADTERDPDRQTKYEQLHQEFATRADDLSQERDRVTAQRDQARSLLDKLLEKPKDGG
ncbi:hypothetical protein [Candidatus Entotheonella palauensis]|uniref:hypothetical protein n=1 Tax=Candidatus Entotheonella palauensis TaxID=93172 RepID=UPI001177EEF1|nr:hypothetical protein [Candidatus Entotheonella palauensis]